ncbi:hypothetical protein KC19_12G018800 [Ceratodon purpureus]|uniref:START domain-containing protein n=1 Tax=Ceratodon purpureus TaxID=3225 RepID=A0A8T0G3P6_CERPU|nr:hypothetical protein KC19_12G018800 [Ceratodon purpureus]
MGSGGQSDDRGVPAYAGWVYHVGTSSLGYQFCRPRFLVIKSKYVSMFKTNPNEIPRPLPMRSGLVGSHLMVEEVGRRDIHNRILYVMKIYSKLDDSRQGEFACTTADEVEKWISAFRHAKEEAEISSNRLGSGYRILDSDDEFDINGPRKDSRAASRGIGGIGKLITIGRGSEALLRRPSMVIQDPDSEGLFNYREGDTFEAADWRCFYIVNGLRIFEDIAASKTEKSTIMKSVGVVDAAPEIIFEFIMSLDKSVRFQWDNLIGDMQLVEQIDGHTDIVYGSFDPKYFKRFQKKSDLLFSRYWRRDQDGSYSITQIATTHKKWPTKSRYNRMTISPGIWEITPLPPKPGVGTPRCLVTQIIEVKSTGWGRWKRSSYSKFHTTIPYILLCRTAGLRELIAANPEHVQLEAHVKVKEMKDPGLKGIASLLTQPSDPLFTDSQEEFYDALMVEDPEEEEEEKAAQGVFAKRTASQKFKGVSFGIMLGLSKSKKTPETKAEQELDWHAPSVILDEEMFTKLSGLRKCVGPNDPHGWSDPGGKGFIVRSRLYNDDGLKIPGGEPLLQLLAVDWLKSEKRIDHVAKLPNSCVQSDAGKKAPFILVINLQVPAKPNYSLVLYFVSDKPIRKGSLLDRFANGDNAFRNSRFKLIPSIVEGYWVVKRAVGTKACLLGKAVTCNYLREDNFLEIDVDIGSSSVARNVVGLVLGYVTSIVVDLAVLIEATSADELPEYILGTVRIDRMKLESAVDF